MSTDDPRPRRPAPPPVRRGPTSGASTRSQSDPGPSIEIDVGSIGRATHAAIEADLAQLAHERGPMEESDGPEIELGYSSMGRATHAAIEADLEQLVHDGHQQRPAQSFQSAPALPSSRPSMPSLGGDRETMPFQLARPRAPTAKSDRRVFAEGTEPPAGARPRMRTLGFSEPPPPVAPADARAPASTLGAPTERGLGVDERVRELTAPFAASAAEAGEELFEMVTFVVRGDAAALASEAARRAFVAERLWHRLPVRTLEDVERVDVTPWTVRGTLVLRVWCRVHPAPPR